jgi:hypothetical protein
MIRPGLVLVLPLTLASAAPARAHDWYAGLRDAAGRSCCSERDCRPVGLCVLPDRREGLLIEGWCRPMPWDKVLGVASPDGGAHACWDRRAGRLEVLCVVLPGAA